MALSAPVMCWAGGRVCAPSPPPVLGSGYRGTRRSEGGEENSNPRCPASSVGDCLDFSVQS